MKRHLRHCMELWIGGPVWKFCITGTWTYKTKFKRITIISKWMLYQGWNNIVSLHTEGLPGWIQRCE
jgi:hypothetical protein